MIEFDEATHTYRHAGAVVPSVTQIIKPLTFLDGIPLGMLEAAGARGSRVHAAVNQWNRAAFASSSLPLDELGYLDAWQAFLRDSGAVVVASEARVYHPEMRYAGTLDTLLEIGRKVWLVDAKTSTSMPPSVGPQTAGYFAAYMRGANALRVQARRCVLLRASGEYRVHELNDPGDWPVFQSCLNIYRWRARQ